MKYLICQEWGNTKDNHAGMMHMCNLLKNNYIDDYEIIIFPDLYKNLSKNKIFRRIECFLIKKLLVPYKYLKIGQNLKGKLKKKDSVYLLEYCELLYPQLILAQYLKRNANGIAIYGLIHLVPQKLDNSFTVSQIRKWIKPLNGILTFGSSLSNYFIKELSIPENKVYTLFHYVDLDYYKPKKNLRKEEDDKIIPKVLAMGNQKRNFELLFQIVKNNPTTKFIICQGVLDLRDKFSLSDNVELIGFVEESKLLDIMQNSDISINIMDDTVGSNVITTSMAVGLAIISSDVGSVRDYCKNDGAIYCRNDDFHSFSHAIKELLENRDTLNTLQSRAIEYSKRFSIENFNDLLNNL